MIAIEVVMVDTYMAPVLSSHPHRGGHHSGDCWFYWQYEGPHQPQGHLWKQGSHLWSISLADRQCNIFWNLGGHPFGLASLPSLSWGTCSGESSDEVDAEISPSSCPSSKRHQVPLHHLELQH